MLSPCAILLIINFWLWGILGLVVLVFIIVLFTRTGWGFPHRPAFIDKVFQLDQRYNAAEIKYSVFFIGDCGAVAPNGTDPVMRQLQNHVVEAGKDNTLIFLGDNIYPQGMVPEGHIRRHQAESRMNAQLEVIKANPGKSYILTGNHDWNKGKKDGLEFARREEIYIKEYLGHSGTVQPPKGCLGPVEIPLCDELVLIILNTQWFVQKGPRPLGHIDGCDVSSPDEFYQKLEDLLEKNKEKRIIIAGHHPLYSKAIHGGHFTSKHHLFPLTAVHKKFYLPLPVLGSLYPLYRKVFGAPEDMSFPTYKRMRKRLLKIYHKYPGIVYASGHDHNLQYICKKGGHYIVSGSGSKVAYVNGGGSARYTHAHKGFFKLTYTKSDELWLEVWETSHDSELGFLAYVSKILPCPEK